MVCPSEYAWSPLKILRSARISTKASVYGKKIKSAILPLASGMTFSSGHNPPREAPRAFAKAVLDGATLQTGRGGDWQRSKSPASIGRLLSFALSFRRLRPPKQIFREAGKSSLQGFARAANRIAFGVQGFADRADG